MKFSHRYVKITCHETFIKMAEVPRDYLEWLTGTDLDEDLAYTVRHYLGRPTQGMEYDVSI